MKYFIADWIIPALGFMIPLVLLVAAFAFLAMTLGPNTNSFKQQCVEQNGHLYGTGLILCLTDEGAIIEIYPEN